MARKINTDHLVLETPPHFPHHVMRCKHCGAGTVITLPTPIDTYVKQTRTFLKQHRRCPPPAEQAARVMCGAKGGNGAKSKRAEDTC